MRTCTMTLDAKNVKFKLLRWESKIIYMRNIDIHFYYTYDYVH